MSNPPKKRRGLEFEAAEDGPEPADLNPMSGIPPEERMRAFLAGELQLADLFELSHAELYEICGHGQTLFTSGRLEESGRVFEALTALAPYEPNFHVGFGVVLQHARQLPEARREFDRAVSLNQRDVAAHALRAEVCVEMGDLEQASRDLRRVLELDPEASNGHTQRAIAMGMAIASMAQEMAQSGDVQLPPAPATPLAPLSMPKKPRPSPFARKKKPAPPSASESTRPRARASAPAETESTGGPKRRPRPRGRKPRR